MRYKLKYFHNYPSIDNEIIFSYSTLLYHLSFHNWNIFPWPMVALSLLLSCLQFFNQFQTEWFSVLLWQFYGENVLQQNRRWAKRTVWTQYLLSHKGWAITKLDGHFFYRSLLDRIKILRFSSLPAKIERKV